MSADFDPMILWQLEDLASIHPTDKLQHGYLPHYAKHLPFEVSNLLEIGCYQGNSLLLWQKLFASGQIHTIDLFGDDNNASEGYIQSFGITTYKGDQADKTFLQTISTIFDVIIDDGSHNAWDMIASYQHLFHHNLKPGGWYIIEDLHCCQDPFYWNHPEIKSVDDTMLGKIKSGQIPNCHLYNDKIAFIQKPCL